MESCCCCCADLAFYTKYKTTVTKDIKSELHTSSLLILYLFLSLSVSGRSSPRLKLRYANTLYFANHERCNLLTVLPNCLVKGRGKLAVEHFTAISLCGDLQIRGVARFIDQ